MCSDDDPHLVTQTAAAPADSPAKPADKELWYSQELLGTRREILIKHGEELYRLRCTRQGKLILHK